jgi:hypothetical protein
MHCLAYSSGAMSIGIETLGRTLSFAHRFAFDGVTWDDDCLESLEISKSAGEVALLDTDASAKEASERSVVDDDAVDARISSTLVRETPLFCGGRRCKSLNKQLVLYWLGFRDI